MAWNCCFGHIDIMCMERIQSGIYQRNRFFFFVFLSLSLAWAINPYINEFLMQKTPIYNTIQETCANFVQSQGEEKAEYETDSTGDLIDGLKLPDLLRKISKRTIMRKHMRHFP